MTFETQLADLKKGKNFTRSEAAELLGNVLDDGGISDENIAEMLTALTHKKLNAEELTGFIDAMRQRMIKIKPVTGAIDTCGTGGDKSGSFNISTASAIVVAAAKVPVVKHGNRAATSKCGSADVLEALSIPVSLTPREAKLYVEKHSFVFLFAPLYHPSLKRLAIIRKQLGFPTVFNILGPLLNPASVKKQVIGTFSRENAKLISEVVAQMDYDHAIVLSSQDGLDEASLDAPVDIFEVIGSKISEYTISGKNYGLDRVKKTTLAGGDSAKNAKIISDAMSPNQKLSSQQQIIAFNAGIALFAADKAGSIEAGVKLAREIIRSGKAKSKLNELTGTVG